MSTSALYRAWAAGRLMARTAGTVVALVFIASAMSQDGSHLFGTNLRDSVFLVSLAMLPGGLLLAWKSQLWGGAVSLGGFVLMVAMGGWRPPGLSGLFLWPVAMAALNLVCWWTQPLEAPEDALAWREAWSGRLHTAIYRAAVVGRWVARIAGTLVALFFLAFVAGEGPPPVSRLSFKEDLIFLAMGALFLGLLLAWKWPYWGGAIPLAGFAYLILADRRAESGFLVADPGGPARGPDGVACTQNAADCRRRCSRRVCGALRE
jgi:hypothetical protein